MPSLQQVCGILYYLPLYFIFIQLYFSNVNCLNFENFINIDGKYFKFDYLYYMLIREFEIMMYNRLLCLVGHYFYLFNIYNYIIYFIYIFLNAYIRKAGSYLLNLREILHENN